MGYRSLYTAYTLDQLQCISGNLPQWHWPQIRVVPWGYQQQRLVDSGKSAFVEETRQQWIGWERMKARPQEIVLLMRANRKVHGLERELKDDIRDIHVIWSMWDGYWAPDKYVRPLCEKHGLERILLHTSGHASWRDLQRFAEKLKPKVFVPIHTEHAEHFAKYLAHVRLLRDGEAISVT